MLACILHASVQNALSPGSYQREMDASFALNGIPRVIFPANTNTDNLRLTFLIFINFVNFEIYERASVRPIIYQSLDVERIMLQQLRASVVAFG